MTQTALFYNFNDERLRLARFALMPLKITVKRVEQKDFLQPLGYLVGIKGIEPKDESCDRTGFTNEMIVMHNFTSQQVDWLIRALNKCGVGRVPLKAIITPTNKDWNSIQLYEAVRTDHEKMNEC